jgi:ABC-2 type transport system permease protein
MFLKLKAMLLKELKQMLRDPKMRIVVLGMPMMQMLIFSFALTLDVKNIDIALLDFDRSETTKEFVSMMESSGYFIVTKHPQNIRELKELLDKGEVRGAVVFSKGTHEKVIRNETAPIQVITDGTMSNDAGIIISYATSIAQNFNEGKSLEITGNNGKAVDFEHRNLFNQNLDSRFYYVPGLIAMMILVTSVLLTSIAIVREKEIGTIEQVMVTPIGRFEFIIGKTLPFFITGYITTTMMFVIARVVFGVVIQGSILLLIAVVGINIIAYLGLALLISASAKTQQQALLTAFCILMPSVLLSGYMFPISNMPTAIQYLTYIDPMRWGFEAITGIVIKGANAKELTRQIFWESAHAVFFITFASLKFKKNLE